MSKFETMSDEYLRETYVPDVYQPSIYAIDYEKLKSAGIKVISFDIDDTIAGLENMYPPKSAISLFEKLKVMGFTVALLTNAWEARARQFGNDLGVEYVSRAGKPHTDNFKAIQDYYEIPNKSQLAHIGNCMTDDMAGGNTFGITTCLVRRAGNLSKAAKLMLGQTEDQKLRKELKSRDIWRKHHKYYKGDQYYQLGETPAYRNNSMYACK